MTCGKTAVFAAITTKSKLYRNYEHNKELADIDIDSVIMMMRWDGTIGFVGGGVDENETEQEALVREIKEEIGYDIDINLITSPIAIDLTSNNTCVKLYHVVVDEKTYKEILGSQHNASHGLAEGSAFSVQLTEESVSSFVKHEFAETVYCEFIQLLRVIGWKWK